MNVLIKFHYKQYGLDESNELMVHLNSLICSHDDRSSFLETKCTNIISECMHIEYEN